MFKSGDVASEQQFKALINGDEVSEGVLKHKSKPRDDLGDDWIRLGRNGDNFSFVFKGFGKKFDDHLKYGDVKIRIVHNQDKTNVKEIYEYVLGKGGREANEIKPPWQPKATASGIHMHDVFETDNVKILSKSQKTLHTGESVDIVEFQFLIKELGGYAKKKKSTLWPKGWNIEKIKRITKEASGNIIKHKNGGNKYVGKSKEGYQIEFFDNNEGVINNAYLNFEDL